MCPVQTVTYVSGRASEKTFARARIWPLHCFDDHDADAYDFAFTLAKEGLMADDVTIIELDKRIAAIRANIAELIEQAAAFSGAGDEARTSDRIAQQEAKLAALLEQRDTMAE